MNDFALYVVRKKMNVFVQDECLQLWFQDEAMPPPSYDRIFKSKLVRIKYQNGKYGKLYLWDFKHGVVWRAHFEIMKILKESWFNHTDLEARRFLNNKKQQPKVKEYIKGKMDIEPSALYYYHLHCNLNIISMSLKIQNIYEYLK